jgi:DNA replication initiation complex subunit (GINS family)
MKKDGEESNQDIERYVELNEMELVQRVQKYLLKRRLLGVLGETECEVVEMW